MSEEEILLLNRKINILEKEYVKYKNILAEFEKWLEELIKKLNYDDFDKYSKGYLQMCKGKLQELKEDSNEKSND